MKIFRSVWAAISRLAEPTPPSSRTKTLDRVEAFETVNADGYQADARSAGAQCRCHWVPSDNIAPVDEALNVRITVAILEHLAHKGTVSANDIAVDTSPRSRNIIGGIMAGMAKRGTLVVCGRVTTHKANGHRRRINLYRGGDRIVGRQSWHTQKFS